MYSIEENKKFRKAFKKYLRNGFIEIEEIKESLKILARGEKLDLKYRDHELKGNYSGVREFHVRPDLLVLYRVDEQYKIITLVNLGSHSELFG